MLFHLSRYPSSYTEITTHKVPDLVCLLRSFSLSWLKLLIFTLLWIESRYNEFSQSMRIQIPIINLFSASSKLLKLIRTWMHATYSSLFFDPFVYHFIWRQKCLSPFLFSVVSSTLNLIVLFNIDSLAMLKDKWPFHWNCKNRLKCSNC
jgi:hypothetical protein